MHFKSTDTATQYYNRVLHVLADSWGSLTLGWIIELLYVTSSCFDQSSIFDIECHSCTNSTGSPTSHLTELPSETGTAEHLIDQTYSKDTHLKALIDKRCCKSRQLQPWAEDIRAAKKTPQSITETIPVQPRTARRAPVTDQGLTSSKDSQPCWVDLQPAPFCPFPRASPACASQLSQGSHRWATQWAAQGQHCVYARLLLCQMEF